MGNRHGKPTKRNKAPSTWGQILTDHSDTVRIVRLEYATGAKGAFREVTDVGIVRRMEVNTTRGVRYVFDTDRGDKSAAVLSLELWGEGWEVFEEEWEKHEGELREIRVRITLLDTENAILAQTRAATINPGANWRPGMGDAGVTIAEDGAAPLPGVQGLIHEMRRERRDLMGLLAQANARTNEMAEINREQGTAMLGEIREMFRIERDSQEADRESRPLFDTEAGNRMATMLEMFGMALMVKWGMNPSAGFPGFGGPTPGAAQPTGAVKAARELLPKIPAEAWAFLEQANAVAAQDLRRAFEYAQTDDATDEGLKHAVTAILPSVVPHLPALKMSGTFPEDVWEEFGRLLKMLGFPANG